ncbi:phage major tail tube protein [Chitiniphilus shinanonensis]|uniref:phage major tail tube protein n=1 Tax=Chitiniphilus shinanonensis TaxID=553088 RepID=UPI00303BC8F6
MIPQTLYNFNLFVDGRLFAGVATQVTPPKLKLKTEEHRGGGMDAPVKMDLGMEAMDASFAMLGASRDVMKFFGLANQTAFNGVFRGAWKDQKGAVVPAVITLRGLLEEVDSGDWKPGEKAETKFSVACSYFRYELDGRVLYEIDPVNMVRVIDGVDQLAEVRAAIGM